MRFESQFAQRVFRLTGLVLVLLPGVAPAQEAVPADSAESKAPRRPIRVAVFDLSVGKGVDVEAEALTDQINVMVQALPATTVVNRNEIAKVAQEHQMALSGLVDTSAAATLGGFLNAEYVLVGRASRIGQTHYLVLKIIDVATTKQTIVSVKSLVETGVETLLQQLQPELVSAFERLQRPDQMERVGDSLARLRELAASLRGTVFVVEVNEEHVSRPLRDPAASMAVVHRLQDLGIETVRPVDPVAGWKEALLSTGKYGEQKVHYLLEGEGTSAYAAEIEGMTSCRARVELRLVPVPGRSVLAVEKGVGAKVDLVESLAAKAALEEAAVQALDALIERVHRQAQDRAGKAQE